MNNLEILKLLMNVQLNINDIIRLNETINNSFKESCSFLKGTIVNKKYYDNNIEINNKLEEIIKIMNKNIL